MKCVIMGSERQTERIIGSLIARQANGRGGVYLRATDPSLILHSEEGLHILIETVKIFCKCVKIIILSGDLYKKITGSVGLAVRLGQSQHLLLLHLPATVKFTD